MDLVSLKCIKIQEVTNLHRISSVHLVEEDPAPLFLAYTPFYHKSEYMSREGREVKLLREKAQKDQEAAKAREDLLFQKQLELEADKEEGSLDTAIDEQTSLILRSTPLFFFFLFNWSVFSFCFSLVFVCF